MKDEHISTSETKYLNIILNTLYHTRLLITDMYDLMKTEKDLIKKEIVEKIKEIGELKDEDLTAKKILTCLEQDADSFFGKNGNGFEGFENRITNIVNTDSELKKGFEMIHLKEIRETLEDSFKNLKLGLEDHKDAQIITIIKKEITKISPIYAQLKMMPSFLRNFHRTLTKEKDITAVRKLNQIIKIVEAEL